MSEQSSSSLDQMLELFFHQHETEVDRRATIRNQIREILNRPIDNERSEKRALSLIATLLEQANTNPPLLQSRDAPSGFRRPIPSATELQHLALLDHGISARLIGHRGKKWICRRDKKASKRTGLLTHSCSSCRAMPRTLLLAFEVVCHESPFVKVIENNLPVSLRCPPTGYTGLSYLLRLAWSLREADHLRALQSAIFRKHVERWRDQGVEPAIFLDLTYLPPFDAKDLKLADDDHRSSADRDWASRHWSAMGIHRPNDDITSQAFWTACAGPLAVALKPFVIGIKKRGVKAPEKLWNTIRSIWRSRYPKRKIPSANALRRQVLEGFSL